LITTVTAAGKTPFQQPFDFSFFLRVIQVLLEQFDLFSCYKCLWMLYSILPYIPGMDRQQLAGDVKATIVGDYLLGDKFYALFYHWSHYYRVLYQHLLLYHIHYWLRQKYLGIILILP